MIEKKRCCGTCRYHEPDEVFPADWICLNTESENFADYTEYDDTCEDYKEREGCGYGSKSHN